MLLAQTFPGNELVILSTCNRVELYLAGSPEQVPEADALTDFLVEFHGVARRGRSPGTWSATTTRGSSATCSGWRPAWRAWCWARGRSSARSATPTKPQSSGRPSARSFTRSFSRRCGSARRCASETGMDQGKLSVASVAVDLAREVFDSFADKTVLVIGAGKMGDLTLQHLKGLNPGTILVTNRNPERAEAAAARWNGRAVPFDRLGQALIEADLVISTTAATEPIVTLEQYRPGSARPAQPAGLDPGHRHPPRLRPADRRPGPGDALSRRRPARPGRAEPAPAAQKGIDPALVIIERETAACYAMLRHQHDAGALLQQLGNRVRRRSASASWTRSSPPMPHLSDADREAIAHMAMRLQNQFLHHPRAAVRSAVTEPHHEPPPPHPRRRPPPLRPGRAAQEHLERITIGRHTCHASGTHERGSVRPPHTSPTRERGSVRRSARPIRPPPISPTRERRSGVAHRARMRPGRTDRTDRPSLARRAGIEPARQGVRNPFVIHSTLCALSFPSPDGPGFPVRLAGLAVGGSS